MPTIKIIELDGQFASRGVALHRNEEERLLTRKLLPNEVVDVPADHYLLSKKKSNKAGRLIMKTDDEATRPFLYNSASDCYLSDPRNCHLTGYTGYEDYQASIDKGGSTVDAEAAAEAAIEESAPAKSRSRK